MKAREQLDDRRFAGTGLANERHRLPRLDGEINTAKRFGNCAAIDEVHIAEFDRAA